jgi:hypothetical protein
MIDRRYKRSVFSFAKCGIKTPVGYMPKKGTGINFNTAIFGALAL